MLHLKYDQPKTLLKQIDEEGGGGTKRASSLIYIIPSTYIWENFGLLT